MVHPTSLQYRICCRRHTVVDCICKGDWLHVSHFVWNNARNGLKEWRISSTIPLIISSRPSPPARYPASWTSFSISDRTGWRRTISYPSYIGMGNQSTSLGMTLGWNYSPVILRKRTGLLPSMSLIIPRSVPLSPYQSFWFSENKPTQSFPRNCSSSIWTDSIIWIWSWDSPFFSLSVYTCELFTNIGI